MDLEPFFPQPPALVSFTPVIRPLLGVKLIRSQVEEEKAEQWHLNMPPCPFYSQPAALGWLQKGRNLMGAGIKVPLCLLQVQAGGGCRQHLSLPPWSSLPSAASPPVCKGSLLHPPGWRKKQQAFKHAPVIHLPLMQPSCTDRLAALRAEGSQEQV